VYASIEDDKPWPNLLQPGIRLVRGDGPETCETARVLVVGEAPGAVENGSGRPFSGPSGGVLESLLGLAGLEKDQCFITNVVKYRTIGNRPPGLGDAYGGRKYLRAEYRIIRPLLTICLGAAAHKVLHPRGVDGSESLTRMRQGELMPYANGSYVTSLFHPAFAIRFPREQEPMEEAWSLIGDQIAEIPSLAKELI
jgi:DNA polymerase